MNTESSLRWYYAHKEHHKQYKRELYHRKKKEALNVGNTGNGDLSRVSDPKQSDEQVITSELVGQS